MIKGTTVHPNDLLTCERCGSKELWLNPVYDYNFFVCDFCKGVMALGLDLEHSVYIKKRKGLLEELIKIEKFKKSLKDLGESRSFGNKTNSKNHVER